MLPFVCSIVRQLWETVFRTEREQYILEIMIHPLQYVKSSRLLARLTTISLMKYRP